MSEGTRGCRRDARGEEAREGRAYPVSSWDGGEEAVHMPAAVEIVAEEHFSFLESRRFYVFY